MIICLNGRVFECLKVVSSENQGGPKIAPIVGYRYGTRVSCETGFVSV
jgi:hypothetical protein